MASIDGISSGLDTSTIISQLMTLERRPMQLAQSRAAAQDAKISAWRDITARVAAVRTANQPLLAPSTFQAANASTSDATIAAATASAGAQPGSLTFRVTQLATAHQTMTGAAVGAADSLVGAGRVAVAAGFEAVGFTAIEPIGTPDAGSHEVSVADAGGGSYRITVGDESVTVGAGAEEAEVGGFRIAIGPGGPIIGTARIYLVETTGATTAAGLTQSLSTAGAVANAQILNIGTGTAPDNRIVLTSRSTGTEGRLLVGTQGLAPATAAAFATMNQVTAAQDATIQIGSGPGAVTVTRSSNTVDDLLPGVSVSLRKKDLDTDVTITVARDTARSVAAVEAWVKATNDALVAIDTRTAYNAETRTAAALVGSGAARSLRASITEVLFTPQGGSVSSVSELGISVDRTGRLQVDRAKLDAALKSDPTGVMEFFSRTAASSSAQVVYSGASDATRSGTFEVVVTRAAAAASVTGGSMTTLDADELLTVRYRGTDVSYQATAGQTAAQVVAGLSAALSAAGVDATAAVVNDGGDRIRIVGASPGSSDVLSIRSSRGPGAGGTGLATAADVFQEHIGLDVAGTIGGTEAVGTGALLRSTAGDAIGLVVTVSGSSLGSLGTLTYRAGFAGSVNDVVGASGFGQQLADGQVTAAETQKTVFQAQIGSYERRLELTEKRLRREFTALEAMMSNLKGQNNFLLQQLNSLG